MSIWQRTGAGFLVFHGIICLLGAFFPFYPPIFIFYFAFPAPFSAKLIVVLLLGSAQIVFGGYWMIKKKAWQVRWYWLALASAVLTGILLIFPSIHAPGLFSKGSASWVNCQSTIPSENADDVIATPGGPQYC